MMALFFSLSFAVVSCGGNDTAEQSADEPQEEMTVETTAPAAPHGEGKEYTSAYVCPMHCEGSGAEEPGVCPVCGMDYVAQADHVKDEHTHD